MHVFFKKLSPEAILPHYAHEGDSGFDFLALESGSIFPGEVRVFRTGLAIELPPPCFFRISDPQNPLRESGLTLTFELQIRPKSGRAVTEGLIVVNTPGTIDNGYRGEIGIILSTLKQKALYIKQGEKIAQGVIVPVLTAPTIQLAEALSLSDTERGHHGFGSTGT